MDVLTKVKGLSYLGWRNLLAATRFGVRKTALERRHRVRTPRSGAGPAGLETWSTESAGARAGFRSDAGELEVEIRFLAPDVVRVTWQPGTLPVPYAVVEPACGGAGVLAEEQPDRIELATDALRVTLDRDGGLAFHAPDGALLRSDRPPRRFGEGWEVAAPLAAGESIHGLGERTAPFDLRGHDLRLWNREPKGAYGPHTDPIYVTIPVWVGVHEAGSYLVFHDNSFDGTASFRDAAVVRFEGGALRYYVIPGPLDRALARYTELTGRAPLPPRWALGFHQSRWSYRSADEVRAVVRGFRERDLPLAAVHLDIHYMDGYRVFTVDEGRFPDLAALAEEVGREGVRLVPILDPALAADPAWALFQEGLDRGVFCRTPDGEPVIAPVWPGDAAFPDFTDPAVRTWWGNQYAFLLDRGAAGVWHDMNEPAAFSAWGDASLPRPTRHAMEGRGGDHREAHNVYALLEARAAFEALERLRPERRPWILTRSGWAGIQRYAWTWTGDSETNWWSVGQSARMALGLGLSGVPYSGPDIGGFGGNPGAEIFTRWFQLGAFLPFFRVHSAFFTPRREPWELGDEVLGIAREHLHLRERLLPYWYTLAWEATTTGAPLVRPLFWPDNRDAALRAVDDAFLLGDALLVAPVVEPGATSRTVRLPAGRWAALDGTDRWDGGATVTLPAPLATIPVLVRAGGVVPMAERAADGVRLALHVWPPAGDAPGGGAHYDDAGDGDGPSLVERFTTRVEGGTLTIERTTEGTYEPTWAAIDVVVHTEAGDVRREDVGAFQRLTIDLETGGTG